MRPPGENLGVETFGDPGDPVLLLVGEEWPDEVCTRLAAGLRHVVRVQRPSGSSSAALDAALDAAGVGLAHVVEVAPGAVAERYSRERADRVASLTLPPAAATSGPGADAVVPFLLHRTSGGWGAQADRLAARALAAGDPSGWFDRLYAAAAAGEVPTPWDRDLAHPLLADWLDRHAPNGDGRRAVVVGCGLGADAELLARRGYATTAFDVAPSAIELARARHPGSRVTYAVADLFDLPGEWRHAFDLVVDVFTVQALPLEVCERALEAIGALVAPGGRLVAIYHAREPGAALPGSPPWPVAREELEQLTTAGLVADAVELLTSAEDTADKQWRAVLTRP